MHFARPAGPATLAAHGTSRQSDCCEHLTSIRVRDAFYESDASPMTWWVVGRTSLNNAYQTVLRQLRKGHDRAHKTQPDGTSRSRHHDITTSMPSTPYASHMRHFMRIKSATGRMAYMLFSYHEIQFENSFQGDAAWLQKSLL
jgi:hypothetical protein